MVIAQLEQLEKEISSSIKEQEKLKESVQLSHATLELYKEQKERHEEFNKTQNLAVQKESEGQDDICNTDTKIITSSDEVV